MYHDFAGKPAYAASETVATLDDFKSKLDANLHSRATSFTLVYTGGILNQASLETMIMDIFNADDYLWYSLKSRSYSYSYSGNTTTVTYTPTYWETADQVNAVSAKVTEVLAAILTPDMNDFEKEKAIHNWIVTNLAYDTSLVQHSAYAGLFGSKKTVCQGYALLTFKMLKEAGIENRIIEGKAGTTLHTWNLVKLDGKWYHLDTTWDDPVPDVAGRIIYDYFNLTDDQIKTVHTWTKTYPAANTDFQTTLDDKAVADSGKAAFYQNMTDLLGFSYLQAANTVSNAAELAAKIQTAIATHQPSFKVRHSNASAALTDLKAAVTGFSNISSYGYSVSSFTRTVSTADGIVTVNLTYSDPIAVTGVSLNTASANLAVNGTLTLTPTIQPVNASVKGVTWTSSNTAVATVSATGAVTAKGAGTAVITATTKDGSFTASATVKVFIPVSALTLNKTAITLKVGDPDFVIVATAAPANASDKTVTWSSGTPAVATVDANGKVHAVAPGSATISVKSTDGAKTVTAVVTVPYPVTGITLNKTELTVNTGATAALTPTIAPANAAVKTVTWSSSAPTIATVSTTGVVTGKAAGEAEITATTTDGGKTAVAKITVIQPVTAITLSKTALTLKVGDEDVTLTATVAPANATVKTVTWSSSNAAVATVDANGKIHAVASGTATISVKSTDGAKTVTAVVTVPYPVTGVTLSKSALTVNVGASAALTATLAPTNATIKTVTWSSSAPEIATVSTTGVVTAKAAGEADITVTTTDGGKTAVAKITVIQPVTAITLSKTALTLKVGDEDVTLTATVAPANATVKTVTWSSSNASVATVDANGKIHAVASGTATISVKSTDGAKTVTAVVTVPYPVTGVTVSKTALTLKAGTTVAVTATVAPTNATNKAVAWSSSNTAVATVSATGAIKGIAAGTATITVTTADGSKTATVTVTVTN
ncbi:Ig-like domain-containing protein [Paenibacillus athensensis]|uniref:Ig-like domain-containing protein n=1 Tax=Paenibacillus athensensis TaxID=1967502 RepID=UPI0014317C0C|nr:Ig-like domain-containing protein [Paenibacillus athensensis]MCD1260158.1 Ig-like domain-containing protein [Paenibacillus athensensis]